MQPCLDERCFTGGGGGVVVVAEIFFGGLVFGK